MEFVIKFFNMHFDLIEKQELASTIDTMNDLLAQCPNLIEGTTLRAISQTAGKGQIGNHWESEDGKNLTISILFRPTFLPIKRHFFLSIAVSLGVADFLKHLGVENVKVKWPNDIYAGDKKICGILIENVLCGYTIETSTAGIGVNINQDNFLSDAPNPVSLCQITGKRYLLSELLSILLSSVSDRYEMLRSGRMEELKSDYISSLYRFGQAHKYRISASGEEKVLRIFDVLDDGILCMEDEAKTEYRFAFKEVEFLHQML